MPPKKRIEATVYLVDCSSNVKERLKVLYKIHSLQYLSQTKGANQDLQQIILYNHPGLKSKFVVNEWQFYSFEILRTIKDVLENATEDYRAHNFLYILNGALEALDTEIIKSEYIKKIVFLTDLTSSMNYDDKTDGKIDFIKHELIQNDIWLYVVGLDIKLKKLFTQTEFFKLNKVEPVGEISPEVKQNYDVLRRLDRNVVFVDKEHEIDVIFAHKIEPKTPFNWYVKMNIGPDLQIPVMVYRTTRAPEIIKTYPYSEATETNLTKTWYDINTHEKVENNDAVRGFKYHGKFATISAEQLKNLKQETQKCLTIFGFASIDEVPVNLFIMENSVCCVKPDLRGRQSAADRRFALFVTSLRVKKSVALAYRVYNNGNGRKFFCLFACPEHKNDSHLLMGQIPYQHEFQEGFFKGKVEHEYKSETFDLMKDFLDNIAPFDENNKRELYPLPPSMQVDPNRARKAEYLICKYLKEDPGETPKVNMNPVIEERASKNINELLKEVLLN